MCGIDHGVGEFCYVLEAAHRTHVDLFATLDHPAPGYGEVLGTQAVERLKDVDLVAAHLVAVQLDDYLFAGRAPKLNVADPIDAAQRRLHIGIDKMARIGVLGLKDDGTIHDRDVVLIPAPHPQLLDFVGQLGHHPVEPVFHFGEGQLQVGALLELDSNIAAATVGARADILDPTDLGDGLFEVTHHFLFDFDRSSVGIAGPGEKSGIVEAFGEKRQRDTRVGDVAHHQQRDQRHYYGHWPVDRKAGQGVLVWLFHRFLLRPGDRPMNTQSGSPRG